QADRTLTAKSNVIGVDTQITEAASLGFGPSITHFRLFFLARDLGRERKITLIGARDKAELDRATSTLEAYCGQPQAACLSVTEGMVIAPLIPVDVSGKLEYVPLGASLREVLPREARRPSL
ncbi:hypothetical protein N4Q66_27030, partial [Leclercia adecarboxylata]|uniref:hypothetical protein n=1 Tax=Leclercia adecarboxylata TaxID=83655 RepID=UPI00234CB6D2